MPNYDKFRRGLAVKGPAVFAGSVSIAGPFPINSTMTFSSAPVYNVPPKFASGSAAYQISGITRINSGLTTATISTTALNSGAMLILGAGILVGAAVASYNLVGELVVNTLAQAASGGYAVIGFTGSNAYAAPLDVPWFIINPA